MDGWGMMELELEARMGLVENEDTSLTSITKNAPT